MKFDKVKIKKMWRSDFGQSWPVYEVRLINNNKSTLLCKCEAENSKDEEQGLEYAELIRKALIHYKNIIEKT
jgi:hypothetical protein